MKKLKGSSNYLKKQVGKNLAKAVFCLVLFGLIFIALSLRVFLTKSLSILYVAGLLVSLAPLAAFYFYLHKYRIYSAGWEGEKQVAKLLSSMLSDDYLLINDLYLRNDYGDIDHIILGPSGIFVLETKNWSGDITCDEDEWQRRGKPNFKSSPSRQVKNNVAKIKKIIDASPTLRSLDIWVEGIVVFTNNHSSLNLNNPTVKILKLAQLPNYLTTRKSSSTYSFQQLEAMANEILKQKHESMR